MKLFRHPFANPGFCLIAIALSIPLLFSGINAKAQSSSATLDGTVLDASGAVVPGATVILKNQASGDQRNAISNGQGFFNFAAVPPGTYSVKVQMQGFQSWEGKDILLSSGDHRGLSSIRLKPGATSETITVSATNEQITPTDSGDKSFTIGQEVMQNVAIIGQNAAEFIKIMPGMAMTSGAVNQSSYQAQDESTGHGPIGSFSANGQRTGALDITADGAHIVDPGCNCGQAENTNAEMTSEVTVMTSNFGADSAKGPVVINTVGKSGGQQFHGEAYMYTRYYIFDANDWLNNNAGVNPATGQQIAPRPQTKYFYPGGNIGGPVLIPGTNFNHNHDKMFFFFGTEYYKQDVNNGIYHAVVPTAAQRNGDFTDGGYMANLLGYAVEGVPNGGGPNGNAYTNGLVNPGAIDPNGKALVNTYPLPTADPASNGGYNYISAPTRYANMIQYRGRIDFSISNSTKLYVQYNHQNDSDENSLDTLWTGNAQSWADPTTPYPSPIVEASHSEVVTANMTKVFTPTLTNEVIFNYVYLNLPNSFKDRSKVERGSLGINYNMLFNHPDQSHMIFPELTGWGDGISNQLNTGFELNGTVFAKKTLPSVADNISKVWKTHTAKFGFYWERTWNQQPGNASVNGSAVYSNWGAQTSGNAYADMLIGQTTNYTEQNFDVVPAFRFLSTAFYGTDSWKVSRKLTLDYGLRLEHLGPWVDTTGFGFAAWYPNLYSQNSGGSVTANGTTATFPGIEWNKVHSSTPLSGSSSRLLFYSPRVGFAWDLLGTGRTVLRGGFGIYHYHDEQNVQNGAYGIVRGSFSSPAINASGCGSSTNPCPSTEWDGRLADLKPLEAFGQGLSVPSSVTALDPTDDQEPRTQDWTFTVAQRAPWKSLVEVSYVGSKSDYLSNYNNNFYQLNDLPPGVLLQKYGWLPDCYPDNQPTDGGACGKSGADTGYSSSDTQALRPLSAYGSLKIINHHMYSNYNALQATWNKQAGRFIFLANYTFSKALGIRGESGSATGDPTSLKNNYGTLPNNRPNIFNLAYVYQFPSLARSANGLLRQATNGWEISGITQDQSGADLQAAVTSNFGYNAYIPAGTTFMGKTITAPIQANDQNVLGTPDVTLMPKLTCDPRKGLHSGQYVNGNCFSPTATPGQQGQYIFPSLIGPGFFDSDLSVFKNFLWGNSDNKKLQFRFSGYNFINHPVRTFNGSSDPGLSLQFDPSGNLKQPAPGVTFGYANYKTGHRIMQGEVKFTF
jgi:hypothetical protein